MSNNKDPYLDNVRKVKGKVEMGFYQNSSDDTSDISITPTYDKNNWREKAKNQILNVGAKPSRKFACLNKANVLDGTFYLYDESVDTNIPLWSTVICNENKTFTTKPQYVLTYHGYRMLEFMKIVGDECLVEAPTKYKIYLYTDPATPPELNTESVAIEEGYSMTATHTGYVDSGGSRIYTIQIDLSNVADISTIVKQTIKFNYKYKANKAIVEIEKWSAPNTTAKIMNLTNDMKIVFDNSKIAKIELIEEKCSDVDRLSYDLTSNYCKVSVSNQDGKFTKNLDLLKKNRIVIPKFVLNGEEQKMGKFYSDDWEVSSTSNYVQCKAYDILYNLQNMYLYYEMTKNANGQYVIDSNKSVYDVFVKVFNLINYEKKANGIFGDDLSYNIDTKLKNNIMTYVNLGYDTAWNMLKYLANYSTSFVYVDRDGVIQVVKDELYVTTTGYPRISSSITPSNAFTYNLPTLSKQIANRIVVPYQVEVESDDRDSRFSITDFSEDAEGNAIVILDCKNFYKNITEIKRYSDSDFYNVTNFSGIVSKISSDKIEIIFSSSRVKVYNESQEEIFYLKIFTTEYIKLEQKQYVYNNEESQKINGVTEFKLEPDKLVLGIDKAKSIASGISIKYANGNSYIETKWRGTPELTLCKGVYSNAKDGASNFYECVSNEFVLNNGLSVTTKATRLIPPYSMSITTK